MGEQNELTLAAALDRLAHVGETLERELCDNQQLLADIKYLLDALSDVWIAVFTSQPKWISVKERLPERFSNVLVYAEGEMLLCHHDGDEWVINYDGEYAGYDYDVTHWMPLPEPPKEEDDD